MLAEAVAPATRSDILSALKQASAATGSDFDYLLCTAMRESSLHPDAHSRTSTACGLFQFVEQTWFGLVKEFGAKYGLSSFANAIALGSDGHFSVDNASDRHAILALRNDPRIAALMAGEYANLTRSALQAQLGRPITNGELYAAHFLGPEGACRLIRMSASQPGACAATAFPQAAEANRNIFYHTDGSAKSVGEVYRWAVKQPPGAPAPAAPEVIVQAPSTLRSATPQGAAPGEDWIAMQLWAATAPSSNSVLPQGRFAATPDVLDILGSVNSAPPLRLSES
ncbi:MAG TPA: transglycosylase SLT domain-containing protein [Rhizomicrobium sp.]|nr:transglycosylase SLT domain-containing protein [Rhizomicrobium sp.]